MFVRDVWERQYVAIWDLKPAAVFKVGTFLDQLRPEKYGTNLNFFKYSKNSSKYLFC